MWEALDHSDRVTAKFLIENPFYTAGFVSKLFIQAGHPVDRAAVGHFRRKLQAGKATL
jgi:hypothetical protein